MTVPPGNSEIAELFERIADLLEIRGENVFKVNAYRRAAENIRETGRPLSEVRAEGTLRQVPGVGEAIAEKIGELLDTGRLEFYEKLKNEIPEPSWSSWRCRTWGRSARASCGKAWGSRTWRAWPVPPRRGASRGFPASGRNPRRRS